MGCFRSQGAGLGACYLTRLEWLRYNNQMLWIQIRELEEIVARNDEEIQEILEGDSGLGGIEVDFDIGDLDE